RAARARPRSCPLHPPRRLVAVRPMEATGGESARLPRGGDRLRDRGLALPRVPRAGGRARQEIEALPRPASERRASGLIDGARPAGPALSLGNEIRIRQVGHPPAAVEAAA